MARYARLSRSSLRWLTIFGPASYLALLAVGVLYYHPHPLPPFWPALFVLLGLSVTGTFLFSSFVFVHVDRQEQEIVRRTREVAEANEAIAVVQERQRIARELHDSVAQSLGYLHLRLAEVELSLGDDRNPALKSELSDLKKIAREAYEEARQAIFGLRSMVSRSLGFIPTLTEYLHDWNRQTRIAVDLKVDSEDPMTLAPAVEVQLIGIVQEAMANVRKHARARGVMFRIERDSAQVTVSIVDDGVGFDPLTVPGDRGSSFGVATMRERAEAVGGTLALSSRPGAGTSVEVTMPLDARRRRQS